MGGIRMQAQPSAPFYGNYPSEKLTIGAGVAIFHLASQRVVVCYHSQDRYWFLPKGRRNANEETRTAAEREGFEESGYRNRVLPLPMKHRQPDPDGGAERFVTEPKLYPKMSKSHTVQLEATATAVKVREPMRLR